MAGVLETLLFGWLGCAIGLAGLALAAWSLFGDRARGRRRCPRCWYDMVGAPGRTCPECGATTRSERQLHRSRKRWRCAAMGTLMLIGAWSLMHVPLIRKHGWLAPIPTSLLVLMATDLDSYWYDGPPIGDCLSEPPANLWNELEVRMMYGRMQSWHGRLLAHRLKAAIRARGELGPDNESRAVIERLYSVPIDFGNQPPTTLDAVAAELASQLQAPVRIVTSDYEREGFRPPDRIRVRARYSTAADLFHDLTPPFSWDLAWTVHKGEVLLTLSQSLPDYRTTVVYYVGDLAPEGQEDSGRRWRDWLSSVKRYESGKRRRDLFELARLVKDEIAMESWVNNGGYWAELRYLPEHLVVKAPATIQCEVEDLLADLRAATTSDR